MSERSVAAPHTAMNPTITIDARMLGFSGIGTYLKSLLENLASIDSEFHFRIVCPSSDLLSHLPSDRFRFVQGQAPIYGAKEQWEMARLARGSDLLHCPHYNVPYFFGGRLVVTIHDLSHLMYPEFLPNRFAHAYARLMYGAAARHAVRIITDSRFSCAAIHQRLRVPAEKVRVIYLGLPEDCTRAEPPTSPEQLQKLGISRPYILSVGLLKRHKNFQGLLRAFALLPAELRRQYQVAIVGKKGAAYADLLRITKDCLLEGDVVFAGHVSDRELQALYSGATLFVLPSLNEGFGLPALEAMAHGVPVIASNSSSLPEVVGDAGRLVNPRDDRSIAAAIEELLSNDELRTALSHRSRARAGLFSAREFALQHLEVYREALTLS